MMMTAVCAPRTAASRRPLTREESAMVCAGTFTPNTYSKDMYHAIGISTSYHFLDADEFRFMGNPISYEQANAMVVMARNLRDAMNSGYSGKNAVGYGEAAFIRAFNSQLNITYGIKWNGASGYDF